MQHWWNRSTRIKSCPSATVSITISTQTSLELTPGLLGDNSPVVQEKPCDTLIISRTLLTDAYVQDRQR